MPRISSADAATLEAQDLIESLQNLVPAAPFATLNYTYNKALRFLAEIFKTKPKNAKKKKNRNN